MLLVFHYICNIANYHIFSDLKQTFLRVSIGQVPRHKLTCVLCPTSHPVEIKVLAWTMISSEFHDPLPKFWKISVSCSYRTKVQFSGRLSAKRHFQFLEAFHYFLHLASS